MIWREFLSISENEKAVLAVIFNEERSAREIAAATGLRITNLYVILHNLERRRLITARWGDETPEQLISRGGSRKRYYRISEAGRETDVIK